MTEENLGYCTQNNFTIPVKSSENNQNYLQMIAVRGGWDFFFVYYLIKIWQHVINKDKKK